MEKKKAIKKDKSHKTNKDLSAAKEVAMDATLSNLTKEAKHIKQKYELVSNELMDAKAEIEAFKFVKSTNSYVIKNEGDGQENKATAVAVLSDIHFAEVVKSENVNGKNEFNTRIAKARMERFFISIVKLVKTFDKNIKIENLVLALLGDLINGQLREEAMENNSLRPMDEMLAVKEILLAGIHYLLDNTSLHLIIPCHSGNHARTTKKIHISTEAGNSLEFVLYHSLAHEFRNNKRVTFMIPTSYHSFVDVCGIVIRFHHGHAMKFNGGMGGIYISVNKAIAQWNKVHRADLDVFGHFHQHRDGGNWICNGSVIGWNEFANFIKADYEKPKQAFFLIDHKRKEKTITASVFLT